MVTDNGLDGWWWYNQATMYLSDYLRAPDENTFKALADILLQYRGHVVAGNLAPVKAGPSRREMELLEGRKAPVGGPKEQHQWGFNPRR